jgi:hypothetical protein
LSKKQGIRYRDTIAAPGSELYQAVVDSTESTSPEGRKLAAEKAKRIYEECEREYRKYNGKPK